MAKIILILVATAVPAFAAGVWTQATLARRHAAEGKVKPDDLPVQYMNGDFN
jgi:hypothetical protein